MKANQEAITFERLATTLDTLAAITKAGFERVDKRFDDMDEKIDAVDAALRVEIKTSREEMRQGFARVNQVLEDHEERIAKIEHELAP